MTENTIKYCHICGKKGATLLVPGTGWYHSECITGPIDKGVPIE